MPFTALLCAVMLFGMSSVAAQTTLGDLDGSGQVDPADVTIFEQFLSGDGLFSDAQTGLADVNKDGKVNRTDLNNLRRQLGLAVTEPDTFDARANQAQTEANAPRRSGSRGKFEVGLSQVVPEWVRGAWNFRSTVVEDRGFGASDSDIIDERIVLPGDLSDQYSVVNRATKETLQRLCWQVESYDGNTFRFQERLQNRAGAVIAMLVDIRNIAPGMAQIRINTRIITPGMMGGSGSNRGSLSGLLGMLFGGQQGTSGNNGPRPGDYYVRTGMMRRERGTERLRVANVDLSRLRCQNRSY